MHVISAVNTVGTLVRRGIDQNDNPCSRRPEQYIASAGSLRCADIRRRALFSACESSSTSSITTYGMVWQSMTPVVYKVRVSPTDLDIAALPAF